MSCAEEEQLAGQGGAHASLEHQNEAFQATPSVDLPLQVTEPELEDEIFSKETTEQNRSQLESFDQIFNIQESSEDEIPSTDPMLFTWTGFLEKLSWVGEIIRSPCVKFHEFRVNSRMRRVSELEIGTSDRAIETAVHTDAEEMAYPVRPCGSSEDLEHSPGVTVVSAEVEVHASVSQKESTSERNSCGVEIRIDDAVGGDIVDDVSDDGVVVDSQYLQQGSVTAESVTDSAYTSEEWSPYKEGQRQTPPGLSPGKVRGRIKKKFKRRIRAHVKKSYKSPGVSSLSSNKESYPLITPTVRRVDETDSEVVRVVAVVGEEGSGKTTIMKRYADMAMGHLLIVNEETENGVKRWHPFARKDFFKFVHYIDARYLPRHGNFTPNELLLKSVVEDMDDEEADMGMQWLINYDKSLLFILDAVDEELLSFEDDRKIGYHDKASTPCIMHNLIKGTLFGNAFLLVAVNGADHRRLKTVSNFDRMYTTVGFDSVNMKSYLSKTPEVWRALTEKFPKLHLKSKVPLFLLYSSVAISSSNFTHDSLIGAMAQYLRRALDSLESWGPESLSTMAKLKKLALKAVTDGATVLKDEDWSNVDLSDEIEARLQLFEEKTKVMVTESGGKETHFVHDFIHPTIRDFLAALQLCEINFGKFQDFIDTGNRHSFLRELLFGIFFDHNNMEALVDIAQVLDADKKRDALKQKFGDVVLFQRANGSKMEMYALLHECKEGVEDVLQEHLQQLRVSGEKLDPDAVYTLASLAGRAGSLEVLELSACHLTDDILKLLQKFLSEKEVKIYVINIRENPELSFKNSALGEICRHCKAEELDVSGCGLNNDKAHRLPKMFKGIQLARIRIGRNPDLGEVGIHAVGELIRKSAANVVSANDCALNEGKMKKLRKSLKESKLVKLDVSNNKNMGVQAMAVLGMVVTDCCVEELNISECNSTNKEIRNFQESLDKSMLRILDISAARPTTASGKDIVAISRLLPHVTEELRMINWEIPDRSLKLFKDKIVAMAGPELKILFGPSGQRVVSSSVSHESSP